MTSSAGPSGPAGGPRSALQRKSRLPHSFRMWNPLNSPCVNSAHEHPPCQREIFFQNQTQVEFLKNQSDRETQAVEDVQPADARNEVRSWSWDGRKVGRGPDKAPEAHGSQGGERRKTARRCAEYRGSTASVTKTLVLRPQDRRHRSRWADEGPGQAQKGQMTRPQPWHDRGQTHVFFWPQKQTSFPLGPRFL